MPNPLFSTYRGGENRVTSSTMAVFERIDLALVKELLQSAAGMGEELEAVTFENQVAGGGESSVPDARISGRFTWWFETKTYRDAYGKEGPDRVQLRSHAARLADDPHAHLFVLTPDVVQPEWLARLDGPSGQVRERVVWLSFVGVATAVQQVLADSGRLISEQTRFLLSELVALYEAEGLLSGDDTVVVAARVAWGEYSRYGAYICQPNRTFRKGVTHFGFYYEGKVMDRVARIREWLPNVVFTESAAQGLDAGGRPDAAKVIRKALADGGRTEGDSHMLVLLTPINHPDTVKLKDPIENDTTTQTGRRWAWVMGQRYTTLDKLKSGVHWTSELSEL